MRRLTELLASNPDLDHDLDMKDDDIVTDVITLLRVQRLQDTNDALIIGVTENTGGITQYGIVQAARLQVEEWMTSPSDDE